MGSNDKNDLIIGLENRTKYINSHATKLHSFLGNLIASEELLITGATELAKNNESKTCRSTMLLLL